MHYSDLDSINGRIFNRTEVSLGEAELREVEACYRFLEDFEQGKVIYGINTGFGPMAQYRIGDADLNSLQYNIIRSHSCGAGETLPDICVRAAMLARLQTFLNAISSTTKYIRSCRATAASAPAATWCSWRISHWR